jgi:outer membrane receptor protein involved in Fe transport
MRPKIQGEVYAFSELILQPIFLLLFMSSMWAKAQSVSNTQLVPQQNLPQIDIIATTPMGSTGIPLERFAGNAQVITNKDIPFESMSVTETLNDQGNSIFINDTQGNPFQVDLNYRGFTAAPTLGTPQGLSVFLDGIRMNEPFGDVMAWDLIPHIAISNLALIPGSNPVYGTNTLGGAIALETKSGFSYAHNEAKVSTGSFGRATFDAQTGGNHDGKAYYLGLTSFNEEGWAINTRSQVRQAFTKLSHRSEDVGIDLSMMYSDNNLRGNQTVPLSNQNQAELGYSHPDYMSSQNLMLNLKGTFNVDTFNNIETSVYYRKINRSMFNSNIFSWLKDPATNNTDSCYLTSDCPASNILTSVSQNILGLNFEWSNNQPIAELNQVFTIGGNLEYGNTAMTNVGQNSYINSQNNNESIGVGPQLAQAQIDSKNQRFGIYLADILSINDALNLNVSARYDYAKINLSGVSCTDVNLCNNLNLVPGGNNLVSDVSGTHTYQRVNPAFGLNYQVNPVLTTFISYSEGFRTPSAIELACADNLNPCSGIPNSFASDPELKAVVSRTIEVGLRGKVLDGLSWRAAVFNSDLSDDIIFNQTNATQGYFANVGSTRRRGLELGFNGNQQKWDYAVTGSYVDATFQSPFNPANANNSSCIEQGGCSNVIVQPGSHIPNIPALMLKAKLSYQLAPATKLSTQVLAQGPSYARGDETNTDINGQLPGYMVMKLSATHQLDKYLMVFGSVNNLLDHRYSNFGTLATNNIGSGNAEQFRGFSSGRSIVVGINGKF